MPSDSIEIISRLDYLIGRKQTGTPEALAKKLSLSVRCIYKYLEYMKTEMNAPIEYNRNRKRYEYEEDGGMDFNWRRANYNLKS